MKTVYLQFLASMLACFLAGFAVVGVVFFASDSFLFIREQAALFLAISAVFGVIAAMVMDILFKNSYQMLIRSTFGYLFLGAASSTLGFAVGTLVLMLLGAK